MGMGGVGWGGVCMIWGRGGARGRRQRATYMCKPSVKSLSAHVGYKSAQRQ